MKSMFLIWTFGPSSMWNVNLTSFGPPDSSSISGRTSANWNPFSRIMSRMIPLDFFRRAASMNVSRRISAPSSLSFSSILVSSNFLECS